MTTYEKVKHFTDKQNGFGISTQTLAEYSGYDRTTLCHYLAQDRPITMRQENAYEEGMRKIVKDMVNFLNKE